jgi:hypothetical protein
MLKRIESASIDFESRKPLDVNKPKDSMLNYNEVTNSHTLKILSRIKDVNHISENMAMIISHYILARLYQTGQLKSMRIMKFHNDEDFQKDILTSIYDIDRGNKEVNLKYNFSSIKAYAEIYSDLLDGYKSESCCKEILDDTISILKENGINASVKDTWYGVIVLINFKKKVR